MLCYVILCNAMSTGLVHSDMLFSKDCFGKRNVGTAQRQIACSPSFTPMTLLGSVKEQILLQEYLTFSVPTGLTGQLLHFTTFTISTNWTSK